MLFAGILINKIDLSQQGVTLSLALNQIESDYCDIDIVVFNGEAAKLPTVGRFAMFQQSEAWDFAGPIMATSIETAQLLAKCPYPTKKYFYMFDLDWIYLYTSPAYRVLQDVYQNDDIDLVVRSKTHYDVVSRIWKTPKYILEDFDYKQLIEIFKGE